MELEEHNFTEDELLSLKRQWEMEDLLRCGFTFDGVDQNIANVLQNSIFTEAASMSSNFDQSLNNEHHFNFPSSNSLFPLENIEYSPYNILGKTPFAVQSDFLMSAMDEKELEILAEPINESKKMVRRPSKNLMAERRRRKRLNDRLSMLRSIVPKISKMDRTAILGDAIDYTKELLEKISNLQQEMETDSNQFQMSVIKNDKPKFDVERRNDDTRIEIICGSKSGLLLSTLNLLESLGMELQHCVISCFNNDFTMQASCSEDPRHGNPVGPEEIKESLLGNAGYGGRCL